MFKLGVLAAGRRVANFRNYTAASKPTAKLVAELRKVTQVPIAKARDALVASNNDLDAAKQWLEKDMAAAGAKMAAKLGNRKTSEGVIAIYIQRQSLGSAHMGGGVAGAMIELTCETDFVARSSVLRKLANNVAYSIAVATSPAQASRAFFRPPDIDKMLRSPIFHAPRDCKERIPLRDGISMGQAVQEVLSHVGEKVTVRRALAIDGGVPNNMEVRVSSYVHGAVKDELQNVGSIGSLVCLGVGHALSEALKKFPGAYGDLERALARQVVGLHTTRIGTRHLHVVEESDALYEQPFVMYRPMSTSSVSAALRQLTVDAGADIADLEVLDFVKWKAGEELPVTP